MDIIKLNSILELTKLTNKNYKLARDFEVKNKFMITETVYMTIAI